MKTGKDESKKSVKQPTAEAALQEEFSSFCEYHKARRLSRNLRTMLLEFMMYDGSAEAEYLRDLVIDLDGLFSLLDAIEDVQNLKLQADE